jgi:riboflavin biosynthesis pyrimidine reductase
MAKLIYSAITSLDGYVADENGNFDWAAPDDELHAFVNDLEDAGDGVELADTARARLRREAVRELRASAERDLTVGGPGLAAEAVKAGLVDEIHLFLRHRVYDT